MSSDHTSEDGPVRGPIDDNPADDPDWQDYARRYAEAGEADRAVMWAHLSVRQQETLKAALAHRNRVESNQVKRTVKGLAAIGCVIFGLGFAGLLGLGWFFQNLEPIFETPLFPRIALLEIGQAENTVTCRARNISKETIQQVYCRLDYFRTNAPEETIFTAESEIIEDFEPDQEVELVVQLDEPPPRYANFHIYFMDADGNRILSQRQVR